MASWKGYCEYIISKGNVDNVMIVDSTNGALWATSNPAFYLREYKSVVSGKEQVVNEADVIIKLITGKEEPECGLRINGVKHPIAKNFKDEETGLKTIHGKSSTNGSCISHCGRCIIIATFNETQGHVSTECYKVVQLVGVYLVKSIWPDAAKTAAAPVSSSNSTSSTNIVNNTNSSATNSNNNNNNSSSNSNSNTNSNSNNSSSNNSNLIFWQTLLTEKLINKGNIQKALILSKDTGSLLSSSPGFQLQVYQAEIPQEDGSDKMETVDESKNVLEFMSGQKPAQGLRLEQTKFQVLRNFIDDANACFTLYCKKKLGGACVVATSKAIIVALFDETEGHTSVGCNEVVAAAAKLLKEKNL